MYFNYTPRSRYNPQDKLRQPQINKVAFGFFFASLVGALGGIPL